MCFKMSFKRPEGSWITSGIVRGILDSFMLSPDINSWHKTHNSHNSAGRRYVRDTTATSTLVLEEIGLELAMWMKIRQFWQSEGWR